MNWIKKQYLKIKENLSWSIVKYRLKQSDDIDKIYKLLSKFNCNSFNIEACSKFDYFIKSFIGAVSVYITIDYKDEDEIYSATLIKDNKLTYAVSDTTEIDVFINRLERELNELD